VCYIPAVAVYVYNYAYYLTVGAYFLLIQIGVAHEYEQAVTYVDKTMKIDAPRIVRNSKHNVATLAAVGLYQPHHITPGTDCRPHAVAMRCKFYNASCIKQILDMHKPF